MNLTRKPKVSVVIPTFKRAHLIHHVFEGLKKQTYKDFEVVIVLKPSGDGTEDVIKRYTDSLNLVTINQKEGYLVDAFLLGAKHSAGEIIVFLDDDAIPAEDWIKQNVMSFKRFDVGAVTGDSVSAILSNDTLQILEEEEIPPSSTRVKYALFGHPLKGLEDYKNCITDSGLIYAQGNNAYSRKQGVVKALLRGPSMAISRQALENLDFSTDWILGCAWEMVLGWHLWKKGFVTIYNPAIKVFHLVHGRTASRDFLNPRADLLWTTEADLLFYRLFFDEPQLSIISKIRSDIMRIIHSLKYLPTNPIYYIRKIEGIFLGNIIGIKWLVSRIVRGNYCPLSDLKKLRHEDRK